MTYLVIDFDSTFVRLEALDELARIALRGPEAAERVREIEAITAEGMEGKIGFGESLRRRLALFGATRADVGHVTELLRREVTPSVALHRDWIRQQADRIYVISGGFREYIAPVVAEFGIDAGHVLANTFVFDDAGRVTGCDESNPLAQDNGKTKQLRQLGLEGRVVMVGDGWSDYLTRVEHGSDAFVAFTENTERPGVVAGADAVAQDFGAVIRAVDALSGKIALYNRGADG
jgi:D-3-phosphoglycerate dehydrogenase